jgi:hypothetical protein
LIGTGGKRDRDEVVSLWGRNPNLRVNFILNLDDKAARATQVRLNNFTQGARS